MPIFSFLSFCLQDLNSFVSVEHILFVLFCVSMLKSLFFYKCMSHIGFFSFVYLSHRACFRAFLNSTHTHKPSHDRDTCGMLCNTRKATLNGIGTERKKGLQGGAIYTYAKVRRCENIQLAMMNGGVK
jgi:hypothetical protein